MLCPLSTTRATYERTPPTEEEEEEQAEWCIPKVLQLMQRETVYMYV